MSQRTLAEELGRLSAVQAAARLIGSDLIRIVGDQKLVARIVETEAYDQSDPASHSFSGITPRSKVMFGPAGVAYVYFTYGMHYCMNVVVGPPGQGAAVLLRALQPLDGLKIMEENRFEHSNRGLLNGPAKLAQALDIDLQFNSHDLSQPPLMLHLNEALPATLIAWSERIGITEKETPGRRWRATLKNSNYLSRRE